MNKLINISITSHCYHILFVVRILRTTLLGSVKSIDMVLLTIVVMLYIRNLEIHSSSTNNTWCPLTYVTFSYPLVPGNHHSAVCFYEFDFKISHIGERLCPFYRKQPVCSNGQS